MSQNPVPFPPFQPLTYVAPAVALAACRVALEMENFLWIAIFGILTVLVGGFTFRHSFESGVFPVKARAEDRVERKPSALAAAFAATIFMDIIGDSAVPHFDLSPQARMYGLFALWSVTISLGMIADARRKYLSIKKRIRRVLKEPSRELPDPTSDIERDALEALRNHGVTGGWRMKIKTLAKRINADPDDVITACENLQKNGAVTISTIGYQNKPHHWNVELTSSGLDQVIRAETIKYSTQAREFQARHAE